MVVFAVPLSLRSGGREKMTMTLLGWPPGRANPNTVTNTFSLGRPLPWVELTHTTNESRGTDRWSASFVSPFVPVSAGMIAVCWPVAVSRLYRRMKVGGDYGPEPAGVIERRCWAGTWAGIFGLLGFAASGLPGSDWQWADRWARDVLFNRGGLMPVDFRIVPTTFNAIGMGFWVWWGLRR